MNYSANLISKTQTSIKSNDNELLIYSVINQSINQSINQEFILTHLLCVIIVCTVGEGNDKEQHGSHYHDDMLESSAAGYRIGFDPIIIRDDKDME